MTIYLVCNHVKQESYMHINQITTSKIKGGRLPISNTREITRKFLPQPIPMSQRACNAFETPTPITHGTTYVSIN